MTCLHLTSLPICEYGWIWIFWTLLQMSDMSFYSNVLVFSSLVGPYYLEGELFLSVIFYLSAVTFLLWFSSMSLKSCKWFGNMRWLTSETCWGACWGRGVTLKLRVGLGIWVTNNLFLNKYGLPSETIFSSVSHSLSADPAGFYPSFTKRACSVKDWAVLHN